jgi:hypothetical protein
MASLPVRSDLLLLLYLFSGNSVNVFCFSSGASPVFFVCVQSFGFWCEKIDFLHGLRPESSIPIKNLQAKPNDRF